MKQRLFHTIVFTAALLLAAPAYAQYDMPGAQNGLGITLSPRYPAPGSTVTLTLQSALYDLDASSITWTVNGKVVAQGDALKTYQVKTGAIGTETDVRADITGASGSASATAAIIPTSIDLLWESDSYVPPFYDGRALPSAGSHVRLVALPHFSRQGGGDVPENQIIFTWKKDSEVLGDLSGRGRSSITVDGPTLFGAETISVEAATADGSISGQAIVHVPDTEPVLALYEDHPLFGVLYHRALGSTTFVPENEMSFVAIPYFAAAAAANDPALQYEWHINQNPVSTDPAQGNEITINAASSTGLIALIDLSLTHATNYFMSASGSWNVTFNQSGAPGLPGADVFHQ